jgi:membrane fusion protein (multidrug efflux system)
VAEVAFVTIAPQRVELTAELPGRTLPYEVSDVRPQVGGILKKRMFTEGSLVTAGQVLYQIDDLRYRATYESAKAQLANAKAALTTAQLRAERYVSLRKEKSISQQDYDDAQAALQQAQANVEQQTANVESAGITLGYTRITAPITGKIGRSYLTQGALVTANQDQALATIQTLDPIYVDINQSTSELLALRRAFGDGSPNGTTKASTAVTLTLDDGVPYPLEGVLQFREVNVDTSTGTVTLRAQFPNPDGLLLPGMFVRATIVEGVEPNALLVPQRAVSRDERGDATALVVGEDGIVQSRRLEVAQMVGTGWLVKSGIAAGDRVIVEGLQAARPGQKANAVPFGAADISTATATPGTQ